jgi:hypothetical protein
VLSGVGLPRPGRAVELAITRAKPNSSAMIYVGLQRAALPLPGGCTFLVGAPAIPVVVLPTDAAGRGRLPVQLPNGPVPLRAMLQAFVLDQAAQNGVYTGSNGLEMEVR